VRRWSEQVDIAFGSLPDELWDRPVRSVGGGGHPLGELPLRRWREVDVHLVDLGIGTTPADWPEALVDRVLPGLVAGLPGRVDGRALAAWLLDRGDAPRLEPWG
jgi:maleylpyruvate isomerase